jgi:hypothetical protein
MMSYYLEYKDSELEFRSGTTRRICGPIAKMMRMNIGRDWNSFTYTNPANNIQIYYSEYLKLTTLDGQVKLKLCYPITNEYKVLGDNIIEILTTAININTVNANIESEMRKLMTKLDRIDSVFIKDVDEFNSKFDEVPVKSARNC